MSTIITRKQFPNYRKYTMDLAGRPLTLETGKLAELANAAVLVTYGETTVLCTATAAPRPRDGIDFFPLSVDFEEKMYSVGRIPGSFMRREGRPGEKGILTSRVIDRPIRPLFPGDFRNDVSIMATVMSVDRDCSPEVAALIGTSAALAISDIPWNGPVGAVKMGLVDGKIVVNPNAGEAEASDMDVTVVSTGKKVVMIEAGANEVPNDVMFEAIRTAHEENQKQVALINQMVAEIGKEKFDYPHADFNQELFDDIVANFMDEAKAAMDTDDKNVREARWNAMIEHWHEKYLEQYPDMDKYLEEFTYKFQKKIVKAWLLEGHRVDGRQKNEIRPLGAEVGVLPRVHGSGLFTRGQTQVLSVCTLDTLSACQKLDTIWPEESKRYMHHYNFPSYSVGESRPSRGPGRREIGHGALGERALAQVIPSEKDFPYTIRVVSEVLESNGSSSQASICASTMSLMAAGVPIKAPVAGIAMGLITNGNIEDNAPYTILTDIQGMEDHLGDMDFKVAGTSEGICALQMDIKIKGINREILSKALAQAKIGRMQILENMMGAISEVREDVSKYAPKIAQMQISVDKIRDVIGAGGKVINEIIEKCDNVKIDIEQDGSIVIYHQDRAAINKAVEMIEALTKEAKVGEIYNAKVVRIESYGAFVELFEGTDALLHVSKIAHERVNHPKDVLKLDQRIKVLVTEIDEKGRVNVSAKDLLPKPVKTEEKKEEKK